MTAALVIARLGLEHDFAIKRLRLIAARSVGQDVDDVVDPSQVLADARYLRTYLNPDNSCYHCYGAFAPDSGALCSVISLKQEPLLGRWLLQWLCADAKLDTGHPLNGVFAIVDHVLRLHEEQGMPSWVGCIPARYERVYDRLWQRHCPAYRDYRLTASVLVPADTVAPESEHFGEMFGFVVQPIDMLVRTHTKHAVPIQHANQGE